MALGLLWTTATTAPGCDSAFRAQDSGAASDLVPDRTQQPLDLGPDRGCAADLDSDPENCGACGHGCLGGQCAAGICQPLVLAGQRAAPQDLALGHGYVWWVDQGTTAAAGRDGKVSRVPTQGCATPGAADCPELLQGDVYSPGGVALGPEALYWTEYADPAPGASLLNSGRIWRAPLVGGAAQIFAAGQDRPRKVQVAQGVVYWITASEVRGKEITGSLSPQGAVLASAQDSPVELAVRDHMLYWTAWGGSDTSGLLVRAHKTGSDLTLLADKLRLPRGLAVGPTHVHWANAGNGTVMRLDPDNLVKDPKEVLASDLATPSDVALDKQWLYWVESGSAPLYHDGRVMARRLDGSETRVLATQQIYPRSLALDDDCVYWVNRGTPASSAYDGAVLKVRKPLVDSGGQ